MNHEVETLSITYSHVCSVLIPSCGYGFFTLQLPVEKDKGGMLGWPSRYGHTSSVATTQSRVLSHESLVCFQTVYFNSVFLSRFMYWFTLCQPGAGVLFEVHFGLVVDTSHKFFNLISRRIMIAQYQMQFVNILHHKWAMDLLVLRCVCVCVCVCMYVCMYIFF